MTRLPFSPRIAWFAIYLWTASRIAPIRHMFRKKDVR